MLKFHFTIKNLVRQLDLLRSVYKDVAGDSFPFITTLVFNTSGDSAALATEALKSFSKRSECNRTRNETSWFN